jgi:hypothetical protein
MMSKYYLMKVNHSRSVVTMLIDGAINNLALSRI